MKGFVTGILAGLAVGYLTAPRSGKETRDKLTDEANKRSKDLQDQWNKNVAQVKDGYEQVKSQVNQYVGQAQEKVNEFKDQAQQAANGSKTNNTNNDPVESGVYHTDGAF
ncbi:YtxH domain-containing protein [Spirosoma fluminis]